MKQLPLGQQSNSFTLTIFAWILILFSSAQAVEEKNLPRSVQPQQQSYAHALIMSAALGSLNALGCCIGEHYLPLWWPINVVAARVGCTLLLPSIVYAYLAFAEDRGLSCHCSTMQSGAIIADWAIYLAIKKYHLL